MREIKFRAWNPAGNMLNPFLIGDADTNIALIVNEKWPLMQYTGLKDKNGKEIYEGDVVRFDYGETEPLMTKDYRSWQIVWGNACWKALDMRTIFKGPRDFLIHEIAPIQEDLKQFIVIGNVYENPGLLK